MTYTWDYACQRPDLRVLYEKSKDLLWNARTDLAWDTPVDPGAENVPDHMNPLSATSVWPKLDPKKDIPEVRRHQAAYMFSNFLHGEQGALLATSQIVEMAPTADAKFYAAAQVFDEARHVEAYDRYLREKIEMVYPISPYLKQLLDMILKDSRWDFKFLGMQIMVEGLALGAFGMIHHDDERAAHQADHAAHHAGRGAARRLRRPVAEGHLQGDEPCGAPRPRGLRRPRRRS